MVLEMAGSRVLAPYLGTSILVWTSLIGVMLASMSLGYWWGGSLSDRLPERRVLSIVIFLAACATAVSTVLATPVLFAVQSATRDLRIGAVLATAALFGAPAVLLGMVLPFAVRLGTHAVGESGRTAGRLCALSTAGSIAGTFLGGYVLVAHFGTTHIVLLTAFALLVASLAAYRPGAGPKAAAVFLLAFLGWGTDALQAAWMGAGFHDFNTPYSRVWVYDDIHATNGRPIRIMQIADEASSAMYLDGDDLVFEYTRFYRIVAHFKPDLRNALMIGGAAYSYPKDFLKSFPEARLDVVEIDPKLTDIARAHFGLKDDPRLAVIHEDGRTFLNRNRKEYDAIFLDAYKSIYSVPYQLTTIEAARRMHAGLAPDGVLLANFISSVDGRKGQFLRAAVATLKKVFPRVYLFAVDSAEDGARVQNVVLVAFKSAKPPVLYSHDREFNAILHNLWIRDVPEDRPVLTDDFAPVDSYIAEIIAEGIQTPNPLWKRFNALFKKGSR